MYVPASRIDAYSTRCGIPQSSRMADTSWLLNPSKTRYAFWSARGAAPIASATNASCRAFVCSTSSGAVSDR
jgi:hypothetical protein